MNIKTKLDILILEDNLGILSPMCELIEYHNLNYRAYTSGIEAISYLKSLDNQDFPTAYLIDMKIYENINKENLVEELESSEKLFNLLKSRNANLDLFKFMSGHFSGHDEEVLNRTSMPFIRKDVKFIKYLNSIFLPEILSGK